MLVLLPLAANSWFCRVALRDTGIHAASCTSVRMVSGAVMLWLLFGSVQIVMVAAALWRGERLNALQTGGVAQAVAGLVGLLMPGLSTPPLLGAAMMMGAGISWSVYSIRGQRAGNATQVAAGNFLRTVPITAVLGYILWYSALSRW